MWSCLLRLQAELAQKLASLKHLVAATPDTLAEVGRPAGGSMPAAPLPLLRSSIQ